MVVQAHSFNSARASGTRMMLQIFFSTDRDLFALRDPSRLYEIPRVQMSCKMQRGSTCWRILKVIADKLISIRWNVFCRNCFRSGSPTCTNLRYFHIPLKRSTIRLIEMHLIIGITLIAKKCRKHLFALEIKIKIAIFLQNFFLRERERKERNALFLYAIENFLSIIYWAYKASKYTNRQ